MKFFGTVVLCLLSLPSAFSQSKQGEMSLVPSAQNEEFKEELVIDGEQAGLIFNELLKDVPAADVAETADPFFPTVGQKKVARNIICYQGPAVSSGNRCVIAINSKGEAFNYLEDFAKKQIWLRKK